MTSSRYSLRTNFGKGVLFSNADWSNFKEQVKSGCTFDAPATFSGNEKTRDICPFQARFYSSKDRNYFHITNDDRRKIVKYLEKWDPQWN